MRAFPFMKSAVVAERREGARHTYARSNGARERETDPAEPARERADARSRALRKISLCIMYRGLGRGTWEARTCVKKLRERRDGVDSARACEHPCAETRVTVTARSASRPEIRGTKALGGVFLIARS